MSVLCYHTVDPCWTSGLSIDPTEFAKHCGWLARRRHVVDVETAIRLMDRRGRLPRGVVCLTFDDGLAGLYEHALPVLRSLGLPAMIFVVARTLLGETQVDWIDDPPEQPLATLTLEQLQEMVDSGLDIGSHSLAHRVLTELDAPTCREDLDTSRSVLQDLLARPVTRLAYPRGRHSGEVRRAAEDVGYTHAFALPEGREPVGPWSLPRAGVYRHNGVPAVRVKSTRSYLPVRNGRLYPAVVRASRGLGVLSR